MQKRRFLQLTSTILLLCLLLGGCFLPSLEGVTPDTIVPSTSQKADDITAEIPTTGDLLSEPATEEATQSTTVRPTEGTTQKPTEDKVESTTEAPTQPPTELATEPPTTPPTEDSVKKGFTIYFIDVGQADAALVVCDGKTLLIDGGNSADSNLIYSVLKKRGVTHLDYIVATHAHEDHVGGLSGALQYATVDTAYCPVTSYSSKAFTNFSSKITAQGKGLTVPTVGTTFYVGSAKCTVLAVNTLSDANNTSIVLRIVYGNTSFLFTGDAERDVEQVLVNKGVNLRSTVLKVGHHGSYTSTSYVFLRSVAPQYAVISCGKGNSYGHPHEEVLSRLHDADVFTFRTDLQGDITCTSNGSSVKFSVSRNWNADVFGDLGGNNTQETTPPATEVTTQPPETEDTTLPPQTEDTTLPPQTEESGTSYTLNTNSMKFHYPNCEWAQKISDRNRRDYVGTREELLEWGYTPCGGCNP